MPMWLGGAGGDVNKLASLCHHRWGCCQSRSARFFVAVGNVRYVRVRICGGFGYGLAVSFAGQPCGHSGSSGLSRHGERRPGMVGPVLIFTSKEKQGSQEMWAPKSSPGICRWQLLRQLFTQDEDKISYQRSPPKMEWPVSSPSLEAWR